ncbi:hypothetical protein [Woodsholea maritima]|uniref:hypothetical protein n=1 Tax=Woodsholea maritima TaxID=240237 RepID=UPI0012EADFE0|nr:hypothetical protein [Woodsholea maritima]
MSLAILRADQWNYMHSSNPPVVETVRFRLKPGISDEAFLIEAEKASDYVSCFAGFMGRRLSKQEDGLWLDHLHWACLEDARAASEGFMSEPGLQAFIAAIDTAMMEFKHAKLMHFAA